MRSLYHEFLRISQDLTAGRSRTAPPLFVLVLVLVLVIEIVLVIVIVIVIAIVLVIVVGSIYYTQRHRVRRESQECPEAVLLCVLCGSA